MTASYTKHQGVSGPTSGVCTGQICSMSRGNYSARRPPNRSISYSVYPELNRKCLYGHDNFNENGGTFGSTITTPTYSTTLPEPPFVSFDSS
jgi:hypothetical protein